MLIFCGVSRFPSWILKGEMVMQQVALTLPFLSLSKIIYNVMDQALFENDKAQTSEANHLPNYQIVTCQLIG
jgi:hypothetical protein